MLSYLQGHKTYLVCAATIIYAAVSWWAGSMDQNAAMAMILAALGGAGFRSAINK